MQFDVGGAERRPVVVEIPVEARSGVGRLVEWKIWQIHDENGRPEGWIAIRPIDGDIEPRSSPAPPLSSPPG
ncbi:hypothetical protein GCM10009605_03160 [Nocardiopsis composta]